MYFSYTPSNEIPTTDCLTFGDSIFLEKSSRRKLNRIVAYTSLYSTKQKRFDKLMIENDEDRCLGQLENMFPVWAAQGHCLMKVPGRDAVCNSVQREHKGHSDRNQCCYQTEK